MNTRWTCVVFFVVLSLPVFAAEVESDEFCAERVFLAGVSPDSLEPLYNAPIELRLVAYIEHLGREKPDQKAIDLLVAILSNRGVDGKIPVSLPLAAGCTLFFGLEDPVKNASLMAEYFELLLFRVETATNEEETGQLVRIQERIRDYGFDNRDVALVNFVIRSASRFSKMTTLRGKTHYAYFAEILIEWSWTCEAASCDLASRYTRAPQFIIP